MSTKARAVRFSDEEEKIIQHFLKLNPFMDFSTLARMAIQQFVKHPQVQIKAVSNQYIRPVNKDGNTVKKELNIYNQ